MSYSFKPLTEEEINISSLVPEGEYNFEVLRSDRGVSKKGNPKATLNIRFWDDQGKTHTLLDWLVFSEVVFCIRKIKHFCEAVGLNETYSKGVLPEELGGYSGKAKIIIKVGDDGISRNVIDDYLPREKNKVSSKNEQSSADFLNDDIPF